MRKWYKLDHKPLSKQWLFWLAIGIPATISLALMTVWFNYSFDLSPSGYTYFFSNSKLPFGILAAGVAAAAFIASIHRSIQTAKQIEEAQVKNTADLYYAHKKFFIEQLESANIVINPLKFYEEKYPAMSSHSYNPTPSEECIDKYEKLLHSYEEARKDLQNIKKTSNPQYTLSLFDNYLSAIENTKLLEKYDQVMNLLMLKTKIKLFRKILSDKEKYNSNENKTDQIIESAIDYMVFISNINEKITKTLYILKNKTL